MHKAARQHQHQQPQSPLAADTFDPDEVVPRDSPLMQALRPKLELSPSPSPDISPTQVSLSPPSTDGYLSSNPSKIRPSSGDAVLVSYLDNGRRPEIARAAGAQALPGDDEGSHLHDHDPPAGSYSVKLGAALSKTHNHAPNHVTMTTPVLQNLAADALQAVSVEGTYVPLRKEASDISTSTSHLSISDKCQKNISDYPLAPHPPRSPAQLQPSAKVSVSALTPASGELPPLQMDSPKSETNGHSLPSIRSTLGDIKHIPSEKEVTILHGNGAPFSRTSPVGRPRLPPISASHVSPPISPNEAYQRSLPSPHSLPASSPYGFYHTNGAGHRPSVELSVGTAVETPGTEHSASTPATSTSVADRMSIDGITNPQVGVYICTHSGCTAPPFQTQYLLNSHANVHSSARPHYCPVKGCPRSEGGKGFKRKNEMIRHGLVHDSPGYVCPFCPDREHKYPRPDNLQR
ncbi:hypothetical protein HIM_04450 [Hirsutella minnesotensis 3608]|uniref:C2H2-type domain-containing protein n=1 Tax=Hirsutella minnesotensis 3608 TaxID=1043627 RepID=A0A0F8A5V6_9HYPO|nr:hypothetical protein HIM_04450 [Hirsutella minnesotensis 3608]